MEPLFSMTYHVMFKATLIKIFWIIKIIYGHCRKYENDKNTKYSTLSKEIVNQ